MTNLFLQVKNSIFPPNIEMYTYIDTVSLSKNVAKLIRTNMRDGDFIFIYNRESHKLFQGKINNLSEEEPSPKDDSDNFYTIETLFSKHYIKLDNFEMIPFSSLKHIYSKNQKANIGDENYSLYTMIKKSNNLYYSHPIINKDKFFKSFSPKIEDKVLVGNRLIPKNSEENKIYGQIIQEDDDFIISLTNQKMLKFDVDFINGELGDLTNVYKPYFYEFIVDSNQKSKLTQYDRESYYIVELREDNDKFVGNHDELIRGILLFSASPRQTIRSYLKVTFKSIDLSMKAQIKNIKGYINPKNDTYKSDKSIANLFYKKTRINSKHNIKILTDVYSVGQGNWIRTEIFDANQKISEFVFDIGKDIRDHSSQIDDITSKAASNLTPSNFFILSHWDLDHILGVTDLEEKQFHTSWFMPMLERNSSQSAFRLANFLKYNRKVQEIFIDKSLNNNIILNNKYFMLGKGAGKGPYNYNNRKNSNVYPRHYTSANNLGLLIEIKCKGTNILLPGDCEYTQMPAQFRKSYSSLVVSHHGAKTYLDKNLIGVCNSHMGEAVACVGINIDYPDKDHACELKNLKYIVVNNRDSDKPHQLFK